MMSMKIVSRKTKERHVFFSTRLTPMFLHVSCEMCDICCMCGMSLKILDCDLDIFLFKIFM